MPGPSSHTSLSTSFPGVVPLFPFIAGTAPPWLDSSWGLQVENWLLGDPQILELGSQDPSPTGKQKGGQFKGALRQNFGRIRNMKSSLQWERRQQWWGRIYSSNSPKGQKFVVTRKKVNESAAFWTLAGIKQHIWVSTPHQLTLVKWRPPRTSPLPSECI